LRTQLDRQTQETQAEKQKADQLEVEHKKVVYEQELLLKELKQTA